MDDHELIRVGMDDHELIRVGMDDHELIRVGMDDHELIRGADQSCEDGQRDKTYQKTVSWQVCRQA